MYELYTQQCKERSVSAEKLWLHREIFNTKFNFAFHKARKDESYQCFCYRNLLIDQQAQEKHFMKTNKQKHLLVT